MKGWKKQAFEILRESFYFFVFGEKQKTFGNFLLNFSFHIFFHCVLLGRSLLCLSRFGVGERRVTCKYGLDVLKCASEVLNYSSCFNCPSDHGAFAGNAGCEAWVLNEFTIFNAVVSRFSLKFVGISVPPSVFGCLSPKITSALNIHKNLIRSSNNCGSRPFR